MTTRKRRPLTTAGSAWGPQRVELGISLRDLEKLTGINRGYLSLAESGRLIPTGEEWQSVMRALASVKQPGSAA